MGNTQYREQELSQYHPQMHNYTLAHSYSPLSIYRHVYNSEEIMEFKQHLYNTQDIDRKVQTFIARYQHMYLVSSLYMKLDGNNNCASGEYEISTYFERVITNLSKVNDIPFTDSLHCLAVALKGFQILFKNFGYFQIFENMFHICQRGRLKVWCNQHIYKNTPEQYLLGGGKQQDMIIKILNIIDQNTDPSGKYFPIKQTLMNLNKPNFINTIAAFRQICRQNGYIIGQYLQSLHNTVQIESILDIYVPQKRFPKDTALTFYPKKQINLRTNGQDTPKRSNSNTSRRINLQIQSSRAKSIDLSQNNRSQNKLQVTHSQLNQYPNFVVNRPRNISKSSGSSSKRVSDPPKVLKITASHFNTNPNLNQFKKQPPSESRLVKRNVYSQPVSYKVIPQPPPSYSRPNISPVLPPKMLTQPTYPVFQNNMNANLNQHYVHRNGQIRNVSEPQVKANQINIAPRMVHPQNQMILNRSQSLPQNKMSQPMHAINQLSFQQPQKFNNYPQPNYINSSPYQNPQRITFSNISPKVYKVSQQITVTPPQMSHSNNRGISVPTRIHQPINHEQIKLSPIKNSSTKELTYSDSSNKHISNERFITLGDISGQKKVDCFAKNDPIDDHFHLPQLESKIMMLDQFGQNRLTTHQFLPNQSHALSNIKWEKNSNSGRDSITQAFRKDLLVELNSKPFEKSRFQKSTFKRQYSKITNQQHNGYFTDKKLLDLIKSGSKSRKYDEQKVEQNLGKINRYQRYYKPDSIKESSPKINYESQLFNKILNRQQHLTKTKQDSHYLFSQQYMTPSFGLNEKTAFKKKQDPYINKISSISEKWEQENICSTSNGSRAKNIPANIDDDILEDMQNEGYGTTFVKKTR